MLHPREMTMDELTGILSGIRSDIGETRAHIEHIRSHLEKLNGRTARAEERIVEQIATMESVEKDLNRLNLSAKDYGTQINNHEHLIQRLRGMWIGITAIGAIANGIVWHFIK